MGLQEPLRKLRSLLLRRGLPADYVRRAVQELADHHADLVEGEPRGVGVPPATQISATADDAWRRLGDVEQIGDELVRKYRLRTFAGRHPLLSFVIAPLPATIVLWVVAFFASWTAIFAVADLLGNAGSGEPTTDWTTATDPLLLWLMQVVHYGVLAVPPGLAAWWFCRLARRSGRGLKWAAASCVLVLLLGYMVWSKLESPHDGQGGRLLLGLRAPFLQSGDWALLQQQGAWKCLLMQFAHLKDQLLQLAAPLAALAYAAWQTWRDQRAASGLACGERAIASRATSSAQHVQHFSAEAAFDSQRTS